MLQAVRISHPDKWCIHNRECLQKYPNLVQAAGIIIHIETSSMVENESSEKCKGKIWTIPKKEALSIWERFGMKKRHLKEVTVCEHQLEID